MEEMIFTNSGFVHEAVYTRNDETPNMIVGNMLNAFPEINRVIYVKFLKPGFGCTLVQLMNDYLEKRKPTGIVVSESNMVEQMFPIMRCQHDFKRYINRMETVLLDSGFAKVFFNRRFSGFDFAMEAFILWNEDGKNLVIRNTGFDKNIKSFSKK